MLQSYRTVYEGGEGEIVEKKSRFIAHVEHVKTEEEALAFIEKIRKQYWDARHNCHAYRIGERSELSRASDDGEPQGTAGRPMLDVLAGEDLHDICVVVTRYFGGTLLGTGGLVRAYSQATQEGLKNSILIEKKLAHEVKLSCDYGQIGKVQYMVGQQGLTTLATEYTDQAVFRLLVPVPDYDAFIKKLNDSFSGQLAPEIVRTVYFDTVDKEVLVFED